MLVVCCTATHHQHTLSSGPTTTTPRTPYVVYVRHLLAPEDGRISPEHVELVLYNKYCIKLAN